MGDLKANNESALIDAVMFGKLGKTYQLSELFNIKDLENAYQRIRKSRITIADGGGDVVASFDPRDKNITIYRQAVIAEPEKLQEGRKIQAGLENGLRSGRANNLLLKTILSSVEHELTHFVQGEEWFSQGSNSHTARRMLEASATFLSALDKKQHVQNNLKNNGEENESLYDENTDKVASLLKDIQFSQRYT